MNNRLLNDDQLDWLCANGHLGYSYVSKHLNITEKQAERLYLKHVGIRNKVYSTKEKLYGKGGKILPRWDFSDQNI